MKATTLLSALMVVVVVKASALPDLEARDVCGPKYGGDQRRTNSPCKSSNGTRLFCGCDRTDIVGFRPTHPHPRRSKCWIFSTFFFNLWKQVQCKGGRWQEVGDCKRPSCHGNNGGGAKCAHCSIFVRWFDPILLYYRDYGTPRHQYWCFPGGV